MLTLYHLCKYYANLENSDQVLLVATTLDKGYSAT